MTKLLECPLDGCHATIEADTEREVMARAESHAKTSHPELELSSETVDDIQSNIDTVHYD
jgi:predicted small metal-binding protein